MAPLSQQTRGIAAVLLNNVLLGFAIGMFLPLVPLRLHELGVSAGLIGLNAAASSVAVLGIASVTTRILRRIGYPVAIGVGAILFAIALLGMMWWQGFGAWTVCRFVAGIGLALHWISSESWVNQAATDARRGRILSLYVACFIGGTAAGSASLDFLDLSGNRPFFIMIALSVAATTLIPLGRKGAPPTSGMPTAGLFIRVRQAPRLMASAMMMGIAQGSALVLMAFYGVSAGLTQGGSGVAERRLSDRWGSLAGADRVGRGSLRPTPAARLHGLGSSRVRRANARFHPDDGAAVRTGILRRRDQPGPLHGRAGAIGQPFPKRRHGRGKRGLHSDLGTGHAVRGTVGGHGHCPDGRGGISIGYHERHDGRGAHHRVAPRRRSGAVRFR